jgi:hypothetical protein
MRRADAACVLALATALVGSPVRAQQAGRGQAATAPEGPARKYKLQPLNLRHEQLGTAAFGEVGRKRMANGDWAGALDAFDAALRTATDPALRRDRGLCHEHLGHPYPAIDDYRAYLTAVPTAPDVEDIHERLVKLEQETLGYSSASTDFPGDVEGGASQTAAAARKSGAPAPKGAGPEALDYLEREDDPLDTSLKRGKGWSFGPFFSEHKWGVSPGGIAIPPYSGSSFGDSGTWSESVGLEVRCAVSRSGAFIFEAGYEHFNSTAIDLAIVSGLTSLVGYEWHFPLDPDYANQLVVAPGIGYEHLAVQPGDPQAPSASVGAFVPRLRLGWRHLVAPSAGIDITLDGGVVNFFSYSHFPFDSSSPTSGLVALNLVLLWGM